MNSKVYKWCAVPLCKNTSIATPKKVFVYVPRKKTIRDKWLKLARRNPNDVVTHSSIYFCEDHFDLPNDMENYMQYQVMGSVSQVRMKPDCMPKKFTCQPDRVKQTSDTTEPTDITKKRRLTTIQESEKYFEEKSKFTDQSSSEKMASSSSVLSILAQGNIEDVPQLTTKELHKLIQVNIGKRFKSKAKQAEVSLVNQMTSPLKPFQHSVATSPFKIKRSDHCKPCKPAMDVMSMKTIKKLELTDSDTSYTPSVPCIESIKYEYLQMESTSDCSEMKEEDKRREDLHALQRTLNKIKKRPQSYIVIPSSWSYLLNFIQEETKIPFNHILLCLKKITLNNSFHELAVDFAIDN